MYLLPLGLTRISGTEKIYILYTSETDKILGINNTDILTYSNSFETIVMLIETWWWILRKMRNLKWFFSDTNSSGGKRNPSTVVFPKGVHPVIIWLLLQMLSPLRYRRNVDELRLCHSKKHCLTIPPIYKSCPARAFEYSGIQGLFSFRYGILVLQDNYGY